MIREREAIKTRHWMGIEKTGQDPHRYLGSYPSINFMVSTDA